MDRNTKLLSTGSFTAAQIDAAFSHYGRNPGGIGGVIVTEAGLIGLNSDFLACQIADESGWWTSDYAVHRNNPSGYGAVDGNPDLAETFRTPQDGVHVTVAHWGSYTLGDGNPLLHDDPRAAMVRPGWFGTIKTLGAVGSGVWASAPDYPQAILNRYGEMVALIGNPGDTGSNTGGTMVPDHSYSLPVRTDLENNAKSFVDRPTNPDGRILAIVSHVQDGTQAGSLDWNRHGINQDGSPVQASAHFYISKAGEIVQDVSLLNGAWSNGVLDQDSLPAQFDEVKANKWLLNDFTISVEHEGHPDDADFPTDAQLTASTRLQADLADHYKLPVDADHLLGHNRFDDVTRHNCPGPRFNFDTLVKGVSRLLNGEPTNGLPSDPQHPVSGGNDGASSGKSDGTTPGSDSGTGKVAGDGYTVSRFGNKDDGHGFEIGYDGANRDYTISGPIATAYTGTDHADTSTDFAAAIREHGLPLSERFTLSRPTGVVTAQVFQRSVITVDKDGNVDRLLLGCDWRDANRTLVPPSTYWG